MKVRLAQWIKCGTSTNFYYSTFHAELYPLLYKFHDLNQSFQSVQVLTESKVESNPFRKSRRQANLDEAMLATVQSIPKLGAVKARKLLEHFHSRAYKHYLNTVTSFYALDIYLVYFMGRTIHELKISQTYPS